MSALTAKYPNVQPTAKSLTAEAQALLPQGTQLPEEFSEVVGEL
jgi:amyloid beta precursor protein binding protein 1